MPDTTADRNFRALLTQARGQLNAAQHHYTDGDHGEVLQRLDQAVGLADDAGAIAQRKLNLDRARRIAHVD